MLLINFILPIDIENKNDIQSAIQLQKQYNEVFKDLAEVVNALN